MNNGRGSGRGKGSVREDEDRTQTQEFYMRKQTPKKEEKKQTNGHQAERAEGSATTKKGTYSHGVRKRVEQNPPLQSQHPQAPASAQDWMGYVMSSMGDPTGMSLPAFLPSAGLMGKNNDPSSMFYRSAMTVPPTQLAALPRPPGPVAGTVPSRPPGPVPGTGPSQPPGPVPGTGSWPIAGPSNAAMNVAFLQMIASAAGGIPKYPAPVSQPPGNFSLQYEKSHASSASAATATPDDAAMNAAFLQMIASTGALHKYPPPISQPPGDFSLQHERLPKAEKSHASSASAATAAPGERRKSLYVDDYGGPSFASAATATPGESRPTCGYPSPQHAQADARAAADKAARAQAIEDQHAQADARPAARTPTEDVPKVLLGSIKTIHKSHAFIAAPVLKEMGLNDAFLKLSELGSSKMVGDKVLFSVHLNDKGQPQASKLIDVNNLHGTIRSFDERRGFGFIECECLKAFGLHDAYLHKAHVGSFGVGDRVNFTFSLSAKGRPVASALRASDAGQPAASAPRSSETAQRTIENGSVKSDSCIGTIMAFDEQKGFGFIDCVDLKERGLSQYVFLHKSQLESFDIGSRVGFELRFTTKGQPQAFALRQGEASVSESPAQGSAPAPDKKLLKVRGFIKSFNNSKGFGFIDCHWLRDIGIAQDVFVLKTEMGHFEVGSVVQFTVSFNDKQQPQASALSLGHLSDIKTDKLHGTVAVVHAQDGAGFIDCSYLKDRGFGHEVLFDVWEQWKGSGPLPEETPVTFSVRLDDKGRLQASHLRFVIEIPAEDDVTADIAFGATAGDMLEMMMSGSSPNTPHPAAAAAAAGGAGGSAAACASTADDYLKMRTSNDLPNSSPLQHQMRDGLAVGSLQGIIKSFCALKGYGFITCQHLRDRGINQDVFLHQRELGPFQPGNAVTFSLATNDKGQPQATNLCRSELTTWKNELGRVDGRIKSFSELKGFGFIECELLNEKGIPQDVFLHKAQLRSFKTGDHVSFCLNFNDKGQPQARDIEPLGAKDTGGSFNM